MSLSYFSYTATPTSWASTYSTTFYTYQAFLNCKMDSVDNSGGGYSLFFVAEFKTAVTNGLMIARFRNVLPNEYYNYQESIFDPLSVIEMTAKDADSVYVMIKNSNPIRINKVRIVQFRFIGGGQVELTERLTNRPYLFNEILTANILTNGDFFIGGTRIGYENCLPLITTGSVGLIVKNVENEICGDAPTATGFKNIFVIA
jgi:hypothetical protein